MRLPNVHPFAVRINPHDAHNMPTVFQSERGNIYALFHAPQSFSEWCLFLGTLPVLLVCIADDGEWRWKVNRHAYSDGLSMEALGDLKDNHITREYLAAARHFGLVPCLANPDECGPYAVPPSDPIAEHFHSARWIPAEHLPAVLESMRTHRWTAWMRAKYVHIQFDNRDGAFVVSDRDNKPLTLAQVLAWKDAP